MFRLRMWLVGWLLRPEAKQYVEAEEEEPKRHFDWKVPENARVTGFNVVKEWTYNDPDLAE